MAANDHRRQKKLQRRTAKRKERKRELVKQRNLGLAGQLAAARSAPIVDSLVEEDLWSNGMGQVLLSRKLPSGEIAVGMFLVDAYCLGVKDAFGRICTPSEYRELLNYFEERAELIEYPPPDLRRLVEDAVDYARGLGLEPHPDYKRARAIFGDIDPEEAEERFTFGYEDGKPHFINGPGDDPRRCEQIRSILEHTCGPHGYHFTIGMPGGEVDTIRSMIEGRLEELDDDEAP